MNLTRKYIFKTGFKYGLTGGVILVVFYLILTMLDKSVLAPGLFFLISLLIILMVFASIYEYNQLDSQSRYWKNMSVGIVCIMTVSLVYLAVMFILLNYINPAVFEDYITDRLAMMEANKKSYIDTFGESQFQKIYDDVRNTSRIDLIFDGPIKIFLLGLFSTIFISLIYHFIKKKNKF